MQGLGKPDLSPDKKKKIEQNLLNIFKDIYFNKESVLKAKSESDHISDEIRRFILSYATSSQRINEVDLLLKAKEKGLELVETHELIFFDEEIDALLKMRAFLIPGMKVEFTEDNAQERITEDDLQCVDHELCVSFRIDEKNEFVKLGNLLDIRAALAKALSNKSTEDKEVNTLIKQNNTFTISLENVLSSASRVIKNED